MHAVEAIGLVKHYGKDQVLAVKEVSFSVNEGEIFGLIGPDGAGKTSIFRMLTTLLLPDGGSATVAGHDIVKDFKKIRNCVGYMPGRFSLYQDLSVEENLRFFANVFGTTIEKNYHLIRDIYVQLEPFKNRRAGKLSGGMKQKLALCCALIHQPRVLFLDEPTTGVDPVSRKEFWEMLGRLKQDGISLLVSTPYMDEAGRCDRIGLIQNGSLLSVNTPIAIRKAFPHALYALHSDSTYALLQALKEFSGLHDYYAFGENVHAVLKDADQWKILQEFLIPRVPGLGVPVKVEPGVEDCFIHLMHTE